MDNKNQNTETRKKLLIESFSAKSPKQMRTVRNNLNNRISCFEEELKLGKKIPNISASHMFFEFELKDLRILLEAAKKQIKAQEKAEVKTDAKE